MKTNEVLRMKTTNEEVEVLGYMEENKVIVRSIIDINNYIVCNESDLKPRELSPRMIDNKKSNIINRISNVNVVSRLKWNIEGLMLKINLSKANMGLIGVLKILLNETKIHETLNYNRVSPFKLDRVYRKDIQKHVWTMNYIDMRDLKHKSDILIEANKSLQMEVGEYEIFLPDFLELCVERKLLERNGNEYKLIRSLDSEIEKCEYVYDEFTLEELEERGYTIPESFIKEINKRKHMYSEDDFLLYA